MKRSTDELPAAGGLAASFREAGGGYSSLARRLHGAAVVAQTGTELLPDASTTDRSAAGARARRASAPSTVLLGTSNLGTSSQRSGAVRGGGGGELSGVPSKALEPKVYVPYEPADLAAMMQSTASSSSSLLGSKDGSLAGAELAALKAKRRASLGPLRGLGGLIPLQQLSSTNRATAGRTSIAGAAGSLSPLALTTTTTTVSNTTTRLGRSGVALGATAAIASGSDSSSMSTLGAISNRSVTASLSSSSSSSERIPRRVEVERRKRANIAAHSSLTELLTAAGVPPHLGQAEAEEKSCDSEAVSQSSALTSLLYRCGLNPVNPSSLQLAHYDSTEYEIRSPQEWMQLGMVTSGDGGSVTSEEQKGVPGQALFTWRQAPASATGTASAETPPLPFGSLRTPLPPLDASSSDSTSQPQSKSVRMAAWRPCRAVACDQAADAFLVVWTKPAEEVGAPSDASTSSRQSAVTSSSGQRVPVPNDIPLYGWAAVQRLHLCFYAEDPARFAARVGAAWAGRHRAAQLMTCQRLMAAQEGTATGAVAEPVPEGLKEGVLRYLVLSLAPPQQSAGGGIGANGGNSSGRVTNRLSLPPSEQGRPPALGGQQLLQRRNSIGLPPSSSTEPAAAAPSASAAGITTSGGNTKLSGVASVPPTSITALGSHTALTSLLCEAGSDFGGVRHRMAWAAWLTSLRAENSTTDVITVGHIRGLTATQPALMEEGVAGEVAQALTSAGVMPALLPPLAPIPALGKVDLQLEALPALPASHHPSAAAANELSSGLLGNRSHLLAFRSLLGPIGGRRLSGSSGTATAAAAASIASSFASKVERPPYNFVGARDAFRFAFLYTKAEAFAAMTRVNCENLSLLEGASTSSSGSGGGISGHINGAAGSSSGGHHAYGGGAAMKQPVGAGGGGGASTASGIIPPLLLTSSTKPYRPDEFDHAQQAAIGAFSSALREGWAAGCKNGVRLAFASVGKGHFNLRETDATAYEYSKLRRFLRCAHSRMEDSLRTAVDGAVAEYARFIQHACAAAVEVKGSDDVRLSHPASSSSSPNAGAVIPFLPRRMPLFALDLVVAVEAPPQQQQQQQGQGQYGDGYSSYGSSNRPASASASGKRSFAYSASLDSFRAAPVAVVDRALKACVGIPQIERSVMDRLFWPSDPLIIPVHPSETHIVALKQRLSSALTSAVEPLSAYLTTLDPHVPFLNLDLEGRIAELRGKWTGATAAAAEEAAASGGSSPEAPGSAASSAVSAVSSAAVASNSNSSSLIGIMSFSWLPEARSLIDRHRQASREVLQSLPPSINLGLAQVSAAEVRSALSRKHVSLADAVLRLTASLVTDAASEVMRSYDAIVKTLSIAPSDVESLNVQREFISNLPGKVESLQQRLLVVGEGYDLLDECCYTLPRELVDQRWRAEGGASRVARKVAETNASLDADASRYAVEMEAEQAEFADHLTSLAEEVGGLGRFSRIEEAHAALSGVSRLKVALEDCEAKVRTFNAREALFNRPVTAYEQVGEVKKAFEPYQALWETVSLWGKSHACWMHDPLTSLSAEGIERDAGNAARAMAKTVKALERQQANAAAAAAAAGGATSGGEASTVTAEAAASGPLAVARQVRDAVEAFKPLIPLVIALRNPGMRQRHWEDLSIAVGFAVFPEPPPALAGDGADGLLVPVPVVQLSRPSSGTSDVSGSGPKTEHWDLQRVLDCKLGDHMEAISKVSERAGKEYQIETALDKMAREWEEVALTLVAYRDTGTWVLRGVDVLQSLLDEHTTMTQAMAFSAFKKPFAERIDAWAATLNTASEVLDEWLRLQVHPSAVYSSKITVCVIRSILSWYHQHHC